MSSVLKSNANQQLLKIGLAVIMLKKKREKQEQNEEEATASKSKKQRVESKSLLVQQLLSDAKEYRKSNLQTRNKTVVEKLHNGQSEYIRSTIRAAMGCVMQTIKSNKSKKVVNNTSSSTCTAVDSHLYPVPTNEKSTNATTTLQSYCDMVASQFRGLIYETSYDDDHDGANKNITQQQLQHNQKGEDRVMDLISSTLLKFAFAADSDDSTVLGVCAVLHRIAFADPTCTPEICQCVYNAIERTFTSSEKKDDGASSTATTAEIRAVNFITLLRNLLDIYSSTNNRGDDDDSEDILISSLHEKIASLLVNAPVTLDYLPRMVQDSLKGGQASSSPALVNSSSCLSVGGKLLLTLELTDLMNNLSTLVITQDIGIDL